MISSYRNSNGYHDKSKIINVIWSLRIKHYQNACQKIKSGIWLSFSILTGQKNFFPNIYRLENDQTFQDSVETLCSRPAAHNFSILDAGQASSELAKKKCRSRRPCLSTENNTKGRGWTRSGQNEGGAAECDKSAVLWKLAADRNVSEEKKNFWKQI